MNIKFTYMYRCGGNFKQFGEVIFRNPSKIPLPRLQQQLVAALLESTWFFAHHVAVPELFFDDEEYDAEIDHDRHEFVSLEEVKTAANDAKNRTILQLINAIEYSISRFRSRGYVPSLYTHYVKNHARRVTAGCEW